MSFSEYFFPHFGEVIIADLLQRMKTQAFAALET